MKKLIKNILELVIVVVLSALVIMLVGINNNTIYSKNVDTKISTQNTTYYPKNITTGANTQDDTISILSFNIQIFGKSKMNKPEVVEVLTDIINKFDLIAIQEVRDSSGSSVKYFMSKLDDKYSYYLGPREGRSSSKEQYLIIYN